MKNFKLMFVLVFSIVLITGCGKNDDVSKGNIMPSKLPDGAATWTEINRYTGDVDADGIDENVILSTTAERDENGEIFWNDGQNWLLYIEDREETYVLLDEYIQLGNVYFEVLDYYMEDKTQPCINIITSTGSGFNLKNYTFVDGGYEEMALYSTDEKTKAGVNRRFSSIPEIK